MQVRSREAHERLSKGFAAWIADGVVDGVAPPDVLATVFRALVIGFETQHRIDPASLDTAQVAAALAMVTGVAPAAAVTASTTASHRA